MYETVQTFGEVLLDLLKSRNRTIGFLSKQLNISSQTTVSRIIKDEYSYEKIKKFYDLFLRVNPLYLMEFEKLQLEKAMDVNRVGKDIYLAKTEFMGFVNQKPDPMPYTRAESFGNISDSIQTLNELFLSYANHEEVRIFVVNCLYDGVIKALTDFLEKGSSVTVEHYVGHEQSVAADAHQFLTLLPILNFTNYNCYKAYFTTNFTSVAYNRYQNMIIVLKKAAGGALFDLISIQQNNRYSVLFDQQGVDTIDFFLTLFADMKRQHNPLKPQFKNQELVNNLEYISKSFLELEETKPQVIIKPCFCFYSISLDDLLDLWPEDPNTGSVRNILAELHTKRFKAYVKQGRCHTGIYSKQGILEFLQTGMFCDHLPIFRPFTQDEARNVLRKIIKISENSSTNNIHLLKNDIVYNKYQYTIFDRQTLFFCSKSTDYTNINFDYIINSNQVISVFSDFIEDELIRNHCHSAEESLSILKKYIE